MHSLLDLPDIYRFNVLVSCLHAKDKLPSRYTYHEVFITIHNEIRALSIVQRAKLFNRCFKQNKPFRLLTFAQIHDDCRDRPSVAVAATAAADDDDYHKRSVA